jgi:hypothetical protein
MADVDFPMNFKEFSETLSQTHSVRAWSACSGAFRSWLHASWRVPLAAISFLVVVFTSLVPVTFVNAQGVDGEAKPGGPAMRQQAYVGKLPQQAGLLSWDEIAQVGEVKIDNRGQLPAIYAFRMRPQFTERVQNLKGQRVRVAGFLHNVTASERSSISPLPLSDDDGCSNATAKNRIAVIGKEALLPSDSPVILEGTLGFYDETERSGLYYWLHDAVVVNK